MSIYHCSIKIIGRNGGRSAVSAAAYRAGETLCSNETGIIHDYAHKGGVIMNEIILPDNAPDRLLDREILWNEVQQVEKRIDAQFAREVEVALPCELTRDEQIECVRAFIKENFVSKGMIADWALHDKGDGNPHAHIMLTVREINEKEGWQIKQKSVFANGRDENGKAIYDPLRPVYDPKDKENTAQYRIPALDENGNQKTRVRNGKGTEYLWERISIPANDWNEHSKSEEWRKSWAEHCNRYLPPELHIDHRSYERQGLEIEPTIHEGVTARKMEHNGKTSDRCEINRAIKERNLIRQRIKEEFNEISKFIITKARVIYERITEIFKRRKSHRIITVIGKAGKADISSIRTSSGERVAGLRNNKVAEQHIGSREKTQRINNNDSGKGRRAGRTVGIKQQLEQRELEATFTDNQIREAAIRVDEADRQATETDQRIDELKRIIAEKEDLINARIKSIMEHRRTGFKDGIPAEGNRPVGRTDNDFGDQESPAVIRQPDSSAQESIITARESGTEETDTASLLREVEAAIGHTRFNEGIAAEKRSDREAEQRRLDFEREREAERKRQDSRDRIEQEKRRTRSRGQSR